MNSIRAVVTHNRVALFCRKCGEKIETRAQAGSKVARDYCACSPYRPNHRASR